ncbi:immune-associated nucleotide-binding protein 9-like [Aegilops tauschii subsp. strangulata]|uniref:immune-associated nucleotide-binding protein 9-like n=1 Tax=Aegilops tauschii subsp. strangulata TaxID=200361 RepID=UPI001E1CAAD7|nr:immune-associated nucleotide-binding protein 9-like [Aegilops tauschii subsp. strangulata]
MGGGGGCADGDGDWAVLPSPPLSDVTVALVGKISIGKNAIANCILGTHAFAPEFAYVSVTETCQKSSATFHDGCGATRTVNVIDTPGLLFDMEISTEDSRKEIIKCIEMIKDGIHAMIMVFSATSLFSCEEQNIVESIKLSFGDKIFDHIILVFTHGDAMGNEVAWKKMLAVRSPVYLQEMIKLCQDRVVLFDNMTDNIECREMQRRKLLAAVDFVISSNGGKAFFYQMLPHIQEAKDGQHEISVHGCSAERIYEQPTSITKKVKHFWRLVNLCFFRGYANGVP